MNPNSQFVKPAGKEAGNQVRGEPKMNGKNEKTAERRFGRPVNELCFACTYSDKARPDRACLLKLKHIRDGKDPKDFKCPYTTGNAAIQVILPKPHVTVVHNIECVDRTTIQNQQKGKTR
jgi:hypothetical protein